MIRRLIYLSALVVALGAGSLGLAVASASTTHKITAQREQRGPRGPRGYTGAAGTNGTQGLPGPQGIQGDAGQQGPAGTQGPTGAPGPQGPSGATGTQGAQGPAGTQGPTGAPGPRGPTGATGRQGQTGAAGQRGPTGATGTQGQTGTQGPAGPSVDSTLTYATVGQTVTSTGAVLITVACPTSTEAIGGGAYDSMGGGIENSFPSDTSGIPWGTSGGAPAWSIYFNVVSPDDTVTAYAVCA